GRSEPACRVFGPSAGAGCRVHPGRLQAPAAGRTSGEGAGGRCVTEILFIVFTAECLGMLAWGMWRPGRVHEFPFLAGATFTGFVLPQLVGLSGDPSLPPGALDKTLVMSILCAGMGFLGYVCDGTPLPGTPWKLDEHRLALGGLALSVAGAVFYFLIPRLPEELTTASQ